MLFVQSAAVLCLAGLGLARSLPDVRLVPRQSASPTSSAADAQSTACGDIVDQVNEGFSIFYASDAYDCLTSVPFNAAVATRFVKYWNETIQFQSTLAYLKTPPAGYQQPATDLVAGLGVIQQRIDSGFYTNQYAFEADLQLLAYSAHDGHIDITAGVLSAFTFGSAYSVSSASIDGKQVPQVYFSDDIQIHKNFSFQPSPITQINGQDVVEFLTQYAALNSKGFVEPHADWNALMEHPALDIQGGLTFFSGDGTFYPGDGLNFTLANGTVIEDFWYAIYNEQANYTGPLSTGGDFYNYFVLGLRPASFNASLIIPPDDSGPEPAPETSWFVDSYGAYPADPKIVQDDLGILGGGVVTGYFFNDSDIAVLSLPSFDQTSDTAVNFSDSVTDFLTNATGYSRCVIDLQQNQGGASIIAYALFKGFFPDLAPFGGSRRRSFLEANILGNVTTTFWNTLDANDPDDLVFKQEIAANEWVITDRLNAATGRNFSSWTEYQGPVTANGDSFSLTERYDLANPVFDSAAFDNLLPEGYLADAPQSSVSDRPFDPNNIVLLLDGLCGSACALFVEFMTRAGVRTVAAGGRPTTGPMQGAAGNRGAIAYSADSIDTDIQFAQSVDFVAPEENANTSLPANRESGIYTKFVGFNLRDQIRQNDPTPLQFKYEAADCRIYYTLDNLYNMTQQWHDAAKAALDDPSLCVQGSTGFSTTNNTAPSSPPALVAQPAVLSHPLTQTTSFAINPEGGLQDAVSTVPRGDNKVVPCDSSGRCTDGISVCRPITVTCSTGGKVPVNACLPPCNNRDGNSGCDGICDIRNSQESKQVTTKNQSGQKTYSGKLFTGLCHPEIGTKALGCKTNPLTHQ